MEEGRIPLVILTGPTAVGKTQLSVSLARATGGEIISADSMQVYRGMDIGSAKVTEAERDGVPHHLIDIADPKEAFHVVRFQQCAKACIEEVFSRGHLPILVGGTGFYIQAVLYGIDFTENGEDPSRRRALEKMAEEEGAGPLHEMLKRVDPDAAARIHPNNVRRVIRALEFYYETGTRISEHNAAERSKSSPYRFAYFVLNQDRRVLYERIDRRVDEMVRQGLVGEVQRLKENGCTRDMVSMQGLGYKEILDYLDGKVTLGEAIRILKRDTRHFAKRQLTWFRRERDVIWLEKEAFGGEEGQILRQMLGILSEKGIWPKREAAADSGGEQKETQERETEDDGNV